MKRVVLKVSKIVVILILFYPIIFLLIGSIMGHNELFSHVGAVFGDGTEGVSWTIFPQYPTLVAYIELLFDHSEFFVLFWNTWIYIVGIIAGQLLVALPAAWVLANLKLRIKKLILILFFLVLVMPFQVKMLPEYLVLLNLNLLDTRAGIMLPEVFSTLPVWILYCSFLNLPKEIVESAKIDGATYFQVFYKIGVPSVVPGIVTCMILSMLEYWNMIEQPLLFIKNQQLLTLSLFIPEGAGYQSSIVFALSFFLTMFILAIFMLLQKHFETGISMITKE